MSFSKLPEHSNALICIAPDKGQWHKGLAKIAEDASPRRHAEISPVKVKDTHLLNNKLPPAEILCGEWPTTEQHYSANTAISTTVAKLR